MWGHYFLPNLWGPAILQIWPGAASQSLLCIWSSGITWPLELRPNLRRKPFFTWVNMEGNSALIYMFMWEREKKSSNLIPHWRLYFISIKLLHLFPSHSPLLSCHFESPCFMFAFFKKYHQSIYRYEPFFNNTMKNKSTFFVCFSAQKKADGSCRLLSV